MKNRRIFTLLLTSMLVLSILLSACGSPAPVAEAPAEEAPVEEAPAAEAEELAPAEGDFDQTFGAMLAEMAAYNTVKSDALLAEMTEDTPPFILDVRSVDEVKEQGHIEGAAHIPLDELAQHIDLLPAFDTPIVTYCGTGWRATIAMTALHGMGWTNVRALKATFADWVADGNPVAEGLPEPMVLDLVSVPENLLQAIDTATKQAKGMGTHWGVQPAENLNMALVEDDDLLVLDVRRQDEVDEKGRIDAPNYLHIPLENFIESMNQLPSADTPITVYCGSGHRSTMAMTMLLAYGYKNVNSLKGGYGAWVTAGYATVGGVPTLAQNYATMLADMKGYNTIKADELLLEMTEDAPPFILDVRSTAELEEQGHIEGAFHIPLNELAQHIDLLPAFDTPIVTYCGTGWRATIAMTALHGMGWTNVRALKATFADWVADGNPVADGVPEPMVLNLAQVGDGLLAAVDAATVAVKDLGTHWGVRPADDLAVALIDNPDLILIDVRRTEELTENGIIAAEQEFIHIPLEDFVADAGQLPADKDAEIVVYCGSGHRSTMAMTILLTEGYTNVTSLKGGFGGWAAAELPVKEYAAP
jgi:rhodanese-related sulfurtransferase